MHGARVLASPFPRGARRGCSAHEPPSTAAPATPEPDEEEPTPALFEVNETSFGGDFEVGEPLGDGEDEFPAFAVSGNYRVIYWNDLNANLVECRQTMQWTGVLSTGFGVLAPDCAACAGVIDIPEDGWEDISNPDVEPDACDSEQLEVEQVELGSFLMTPAEANGGESFLQLALIDVATAGVLGLEVTVDADPSLEELDTQLDDAGLLLSHIGYVSTAPESWLTGLSGVAGASGEDEEFAAMWLVYRQPDVNPETSSALMGAHVLGSIWIVQ